MLSKVLPIFLCLLYPTYGTSDINQHNAVSQNVDADFKAQANGLNLVPVRADGKHSKYFFNVTADSGHDTLAFFETAGPLLLTLSEKTKDGKIEKYTYQMTGKTTMSGTRTGDKINLVMKYEDGGANNTAKFVVSSAEIQMLVLTGKSSPVSGYWFVKSIDLSVTYTLDQQAPVTKKLDLTPRQGYTSRKSDIACGAGYSLCAPLTLAWTCFNQRLQKVDVEAAGSSDIVLQMIGLKLQPFKAGETILSYGHVWDCDPLIPLSIWTGVIISLLLAAIVWWALAMLSTIYSPSKFDDAKGPGLQIAHTE